MRILVKKSGVEHSGIIRREDDWNTMPKQAGKRVIFDTRIGAA
jgi:hypothetical protein